MALIPCPRGHSHSYVLKYGPLPTRRYRENTGFFKIFMGESPAVESERTLSEAPRGRSDGAEIRPPSA